MTSSWTETGVTWTNQPSAASSVSSSASVTLGAASGTVVEWSVIGDTQAFVTGSATNSGWRITDSAEGAAVGTLLTFNSREAASGRPQLVDTGCVAPSPTTPLSCQQDSEVAFSSDGKSIVFVRASTDAAGLFTFLPRRIMHAVVFGQ